MRDRLACPDCPGRGTNLKHAATCPQGLALDVLMAQDRKWFESHPGAESYVRPITQVEVTELRMAGNLPDGGDVEGNIRVTQLAPGIRVRRSEDLVIYFGGEV